MPDRIDRILPSKETRGRALESYERVTDPPLLILALAIVPLIVLPFVLDLDPAVEDALFAVDWMIWAGFAVDLGIRTYLSERRVNYLVTHWYDVLIVVVPFLRPLRVLRSARLLRSLRLTRTGAFAIRFTATARVIGRRNGLAYVLLIGVLLLFVSATLVFAFEREAGGEIDDFGTALWWAIVTITTVGYGDTFPVTNEGRAIAVFLMVIGISLFGFLTANIAAFFVSQDQQTSDGTNLEDIASKLESLENEVRALKHEVVRDRSGGEVSPAIHRAVADDL